MSTYRAVAMIGLALLVAAAALVLADQLDAPWLGIGAVVALISALVVREVWIWKGQGRQYLVMAGGLALVIAGSFLARKIFG